MLSPISLIFIFLGIQKSVLLIVRGYNIAHFSVSNSSQQQTLHQKMHETLHAVSNSWATNPPDRFVSICELGDTALYQDNSILPKLDGL